MSDPAEAPTAVVLGGGGRFGAVEVGMLAALAEAGVRPDIVLGTSIGAVNGAAFAADPTPGGMRRLRDMWVDLDTTGVFGGTLVERVRHMARSRTSLHSAEPLERLLREVLPEGFEDLDLRFECVAACIETAHGTWFNSGDLVPAVMASSAVPGLLPAVHIHGHHYLDGGLVDSIPVRRAVHHGATLIHVVQVGRMEQPLRPPRWPHEVGMVAFEIARRHTYAAALADLPEHVELHVLPTGGKGPRFTDFRQLRYRDFSDVAGRIDAAHEATAAYLELHELGS